VLITHPQDVTALDRYGAAMTQLPPGSPQSLLRGMFVQVRVTVDSPGVLVSIPEEALRPSGEVWVMREGRLVILKPRAVQVSGGRVVFDSAISGLLAGDRVVTSQLTAPRADMEITETAGVSATPTHTAETTADIDAL
jgi:multidrug efflux pump subunit AcrA (membrane-fusion protein)